MPDAVVLLLAGILADAAACEGLKALRLPNTTIASAQLVPAGPYAPPLPAAAAGPAPALSLPAHCRVSVVMNPSPDSHIEMDVWLPAQDWNGKFQAVGNGGWAGTINYPAMARALLEGYATASTDTGHKGSGASGLFAVGHPEKLVDFAYRAVHLMAVWSKAIITSFFRRPPRLSYWNGCSTGGRQGLMSAQKYPEDFDAIIAGAPANYHTHLHLAGLSVFVPLLKDPAGIVPAAKLAMVNRAVLDACDASDGVKDRLLNDPPACSFEVSSLACKGSDATDCLTDAQIASVKRVYAATKTASGEVVLPGKDPGSEAQWLMLSGATPPIVLGSFQVAYDNANWDPGSFDLERDMKVVDDKVGAITNAINPDLRAFRARGGKLLLYHGWNDPLISARNTIDYYRSVQTKMGGDQDDWTRLFMAPGMGHCSGGPGPSQANWMAALERWRESGTAPDRIDVARVIDNRVDMTRPLCPYPQIAHYKGVGSTNDAANFVCRAK